MNMFTVPRSLNKNPSLTVKGEFAADLISYIPVFLSKSRKLQVQTTAGLAAAVICSIPEDSDGCL